MRSFLLDFRPKTERTRAGDRLAVRQEKGPRRGPFRHLGLLQPQLSCWDSYGCHALIHADVQRDAAGRQRDLSSSLVKSPDPDALVASALTLAAVAMQRTA